MADPITNYLSLQAAFENYLARPDIAEYLPNFIQVTEAMLNRKLRTREMMSSSQLAPTLDGGGNPSGYQVPTDYLEWIAARYFDPTGKIAHPVSMRYVEPDSPEFRHRYRPNGSPQYFSVLGDEIQTRSDRPGVVILNYYRAIPPLTDAAPTNWLLTKAPELYLYGCLAEGYRFQKDDQRAEKWLGDAMAFLDALMGQGDGQKVARRPTRAAEDKAEALARDTPN